MTRYTPSMGRTLATRLYSIFLLGLFVGSGIGAPALDEFLYHTGRDAGPPPGIPHFDPPSGCNAHSEHCVLASFVSVRPMASASHTLPRIEVITRDYTAFRLVYTLRSINRSLLQPSRAPPVFAS